MSNAEVFERVCRFLEENKLASTLQAFRKEHDKDSSKRTERFRKPVPAEISKVKFDKTNSAEVSAVREALQHADDRILNRLVEKMCKACTTEEPKQKEANCRLQKLKFYRKLLDKEAEANANRHNHRDPNDISNIRNGQDNDVSVISKPEEVLDILQDDIDEYDGPQDAGYQCLQCPESDLKALCKEIAVKKGYPQKAIAPNSSRYPEEYYNAKSYMNEHKPTNDKTKDASQHIKLPRNLKFPDSNDQVYPMEYNGVIYDVYHLKVIFDQDHTTSCMGTFQIVINDVVGGRYQILSMVGQAQFSRAVKVLNLQDGQQYCMKIINNIKDYVDQSIDEIKLLTYINHNGNVDEKHVLRFHDYFYFKDHLFIVTELLKDNLFDAYRMNLKSQEPKYFNLRRVQKFAQQIMTAMEYIHSLHIIHCDLKPENILIKSYANETVKVIDFGSSTFFHDNLSFYLQTRSYRAPEIIIGVKYDEKIDIWSVGCILAEIYSGKVLFENQTVGGMLAKIQGIIGAWPEWMIAHGQLTNKFFTKSIVINEEILEEDPYNEGGAKVPTGYYRALIPKMTNLKARIGCSDEYFLNFLKGCLKIDPSQRFSARQALRHPFITEANYTDED